MSNRTYIPRSVYLACRFGRQAEMREVRTVLHNAGIMVTSTWIDATFDDKDTDEAGLQRAATTNLRDVAAAEFLITFTEEPGIDGASRGGRHVELGYAIAAGMTVIKIGPRENVFHYHGQVRGAVDLDTAIAVLDECRKRELYK